MLSLKLINEFSEIMAKEFGVELDAEEARNIAEDLKSYMEILAFMHKSTNY